MAHYMFRWQFTADSARSMITKPQDRSVAARALIEGFGGRMEAYYFAFGEFDGVGICEFPDNGSAAACSMTAGSTGAFSKFETTALLTANEAEQAMKKARDTKTGYAPPNVS